MLSTVAILAFPIDFGDPGDGRCWQFSWLVLVFWSVAGCVLFEAILLAEIGADGEQERGPVVVGVVAAGECTAGLLPIVRSAFF